MTWMISGVRDLTHRFENLEPIEVLYELETPKIFTAKCGDELVLVYESCIDIANRCVRLIVSPTSPSLVSALKDGAKTVVQALDQPWVWALTQDFDGNFQEAFLLSNGIDSIPEGYKPKKSAMLWPELMPLVSVRLIGAGLREGHVPASVIRRAAEGIPAALKKCFEGWLGAKAQGRPDESIRNLYDLEAQQLAYASFEISFRAAQPPQLPLAQGFGTDPYVEQGVALRDAIEWAVEEDTSSAPSLDLVEAVEKLAPPMHGVVEQVEVRGKIFKDSRAYILNRTTTKKVKRYLTEQRALARSLITVDGKIDELDKGRLTFILRGTSDNKDKSFTFSEDFLDDVFIAFNSSVPVSVSGRQIAGRQPIEMLGLDFLNPPGGDV